MTLFEISQAEHLLISVVAIGQKSLLRFHVVFLHFGITISVWIGRGSWMEGDIMISGVISLSLSPSFGFTVSPSPSLSRDKHTYLHGTFFLDE